MTTSNALPRFHVLRLAVLAFCMLLPVTLPAPVLRGLVHDRFEVSEFLTSLFMSVNMIGAILCAPIAGMIADRVGRHVPIIAAALIVDGACMAAMAAPIRFEWFLGLRFVEGCAHITALSLLLGLGASAGEGRGRAMGALGAGLTLGVAFGAPLGGVLGKSDPTRTLEIGAAVLLATAGLAAWWLRGTPAPARRHEGSPFRAVSRDRALSVPIAFAFVDRFTVGFFVSTFPLYLKRVFDLPSSQIGFLLALFLLPFSVLSYPAGKLSERVSRSALVAGGSLVYGGLVLTLGFWSASGLPWLMAMLGILSAVMFVPSLLMVTDLAPNDLRSTSLGAFNAAGSAGFLAGPLVGGAVSQTVAATHGWETGYATAFGVAGAAEIVCVALTLPALRHLVRSGRVT